MKVTRLNGIVSGVFIGLAAVMAGNALAQTATGGGSSTTSTIPVVTIRATDPLASWSGNPGMFTVYRSGNPQPALNVYYQISGTASNGWDYQQLGSFAYIPSGVLSADVVIQPINRGQTSDATVVLTLTNSPLLGPATPVNYEIGDPSTATVLITSKTLTNYPPLVALVFPTNGATFYTPLKLPLVACAADPDGFVESVEFFADGVSLGVVSNSPTVLPLLPGPTPPLPPMPPYRPFIFVWTNVPPGTNIMLTATATDNQGATTTSSPVTITVHPGPPPPPPPSPNLLVRISSPADGSTFRAPLNLPLFAYAAARTGYVAAVEFFAGATDLGPGHPVPTPIAGAGPLPASTLLSNLWVFVWSNPPTGMFALSAVAADNGGQSVRSDAVNVTILPPLPPPPPTNVVDIIAADPIAIEGTNCWPWLGLASATPTWGNWTASAAVCRYFTNCGPKNALFIVRRFGDTNADLAVNYAIGGTATNGVDYVTLPGTVTIPAGHRAALIPVIPIDDGPPDITATVVLRLQPSPNYGIRFPAAAGAIILDFPSPTAVSGMVANQTFHVKAAGPDGAWFLVESTTDLVNWRPICTTQVIHGSIDFIDPDATGQLCFYRAVPQFSAP